MLSQLSVMSEYDPLNQDNILDLLPDKCRDCSLAKFSILVVLMANGMAGSPLDLIREVDEDCAGYRGSTSSEPGSTMHIFQSATGRYISLQFDPSDENCPMFSEKNE